MIGPFEPSADTVKAVEDRKYAMYRFSNHIGLGLGETPDVVNELAEEFDRLRVIAERLVRRDLLHYKQRHLWQGRPWPETKYDDFTLRAYREP